MRHTTGEKIRIARTLAHLSQQELADKMAGCEPGKANRKQVKAWEHDEAYPRGDNLIELCKVLKVSADYILGLEETSFEEMTGLSDESLYQLKHAKKSDPHIIQALNRLLTDMNGRKILSALAEWK